MANPKLDFNLTVLKNIINSRIQGPADFTGHYNKIKQCLTLCVSCRRIEQKMIIFQIHPHLLLCCSLGKSHMCGIYSNLCTQKERLGWVIELTTSSVK